MASQDKDEMLFWQLPYGWRTGSRYIPPGASASDVVRYEQEELGNALDVPEFVLTALEHVQAKEVVWVCRTKQHARRYGGKGRGLPYQEKLGSNALVLATDQENETGYLVLSDATLIDPGVVNKFAAYRSASRKETFREVSNK